MKLALLNQLEQSHWWSPEQFFKQQLRQAGALLLQAYRHVLVYRERLAQVGFLPGKPLTPEIWRRIPALTRADLQRAGERLYASEIPSQHGRTYEIFSSAPTRPSAAWPRWPMPSRPATSGPARLSYARAPLAGP